MVTTRVVLALVAIPLFVAAVVALRRDRRPLALWLLAAGSGLATAWASLSALRASALEDDIPLASSLALAVMGAVTTWYFIRSVLDGRFPGE